MTLRIPRAVTAGLVLLAALALGLAGCRAKQAGPAPAASSGATYRGPSYLNGTVGSLTQTRHNRPLIVTGYGLVVDLAGTGSSEVPQELRQWMINDMTKRGVGLASYSDILPLTPEQMLASDRTAVVRVVGFIPPGAVAGTRFDVLVEAADSRTTSLAGGRLWSCDLAPGSNRPGVFVDPIAAAGGPMFVSPTDPAAATRFEIQNYQRRAVVVTGGVLKKSRPLELVLNQSSRSRASAIADRINERFPAVPGARRPTANAISPLVVQLAVPAQYHDRPAYFVQLVRHLSADRSPDAVPRYAQYLAEKLIEDPERAESVCLAWEALGPAAGVVLRRYYRHARIDVSLAALHAGAALGDEAAGGRLRELASHEDPDVRINVARSFKGLSGSDRDDHALRTLLDDAVVEVRIAAYETLVASGSPLVDRQELVDVDGNLKMVIDLLPVRDPLVYITQDRYPRLVIFGPETGFPPATSAAIWDGRLRISRADDSSQPARMLFQRSETEGGRRVMKSSAHDFYPSLATLAYVLAHKWNGDNDPQLGFDLTYGETVDAVYQLAKNADTPTPVHVDRGLFTRLLEGVQSDGPQQRPETGPAAQGRPNPGRGASQIGS